jgi:hypothetical protein
VEACAHDLSSCRNFAFFSVSPGLAFTLSIQAGPAERTVMTAGLTDLDLEPEGPGGKKIIFRL